MESQMQRALISACFIIDNSGEADTHKQNKKSAQIYSTINFGIKISPW
jgi:hypothetical protein